MEPGLIVPFGRYVLKERLAQGGMGEVFRAVAVGEHGFEKPVVVKRVLPAHAGREDLTELFVAEAKLMTRLAHPNIVEVLDFGRGEHQDYYLVLELVDGTDLGRLMRAVSGRGEPFPVPLALFIASQVLRGLHHAHTKSAGEGGVIVHRDVSPSNVLCSAEGEVKVADFGVALVTHAGEGSEGGGVAGKPGYMAPEQFDEGRVDPRADVFSAAVVLQQMLTGELPFRGETVEAQQEAARRGAREPARDRRAEVSEAVEAILARAMAPAPEARFPDARAMAQAIESLRDEGQRIATGDDLAEAVRAAQRELPAAGRKVIALTGATSAAAGPDSADGPRELTRSGGAGGVGAFTLRFPVRADATTRQRTGAEDAVPHPPDRWSAPEPRTERIAADGRPADSAAGLPFVAEAPVTVQAPALASPVETAPTPAVTMGAPASHPPGLAEPDEAPAETPRQRAIRRTAIGAVVAAALLAAAAFGVRAPWASGPPVPAAKVSAAKVPAAPVPTSTSSETAAPPSPPPAVSAPPGPRVAGRLPVLRVPVSAAPVAGAAPSVTAAPTAAPVDCAGDVAFFSDGAWIITGGPRAVQSPSKGEVWPCGTYALVARSRQDPTQVKTASVTVSPLRHASVDLR